MTHPAERKPSPIMAIHKRYEEATTEYEVIEKAEAQAHRKKDEYAERDYLRALKAISRETDALTLALLYQVPDSWVEAMILQFHIANATDLLLGCDEAPEEDVAALQTAIDTLFDFMCCEVRQDHGEIGPAFQDGANRVFFQRRRRTGNLED